MGRSPSPWQVLMKACVEPTDYTKLWNSLRESISLVKGSETAEPGQGTFAHITGGYDAGYYGFVFFLETIRW